MTPLERLLAEELPTGTFGNGSSKPTRRRKPPVKAEPQPDPHAAAHRARLLAALAEKPLKVGRRAQPARHLTAVPPAA